jgi:hypothetical protein
MHTKLCTNICCVRRFLYLLTNCAVSTGNRNRGDHARAQAVRVLARIKSCAICGAQSFTETGSPRVLRFPLPILIPATAPHPSPSTIRCRYSRPNSGRCTQWAAYHSSPRNRKRKKLTLQNVGLNCSRRTAWGWVLGTSCAVLGLRNLAT